MIIGCHSHRTIMRLLFDMVAKSRKGRVCCHDLYRSNAERWNKKKNGKE